VLNTAKNETSRSSIVAAQCKEAFDALIAIMWDTQGVTVETYLTERHEPGVKTMENERGYRPLML
jgi:hypothetical protein